jgi:hypothetical protein
VFIPTAASMELQILFEPIYAASSILGDPVIFLDDIKVNNYFQLMDPSFESYTSLFNSVASNILTTRKTIS